MEKFATTDNEKERLERFVEVEIFDGFGFEWYFVKKSERILEHHPRYGSSTLEKE